MRFGVFEADLATRELRCRGLKVKLQERPFQVLALLLDHPGQVVTREELRKTLWPTGTFVDFDNGINAAVNRLREALRDSADNPRFVETVGRRGYRWIPVVSALPEPEPPAPQEQSWVILTDKATTTRGEVPDSQASGPVLRTAPSVRRNAAIGVLAVSAVLLAALGWGLLKWRYRTQMREAARGIRSIAVLPLENLSGDPAQEYFSDGLTDELITDLARSTAIRVISRTSVMQYKGMHRPAPEVARKLSVDGLVEGTVERAADRVRIRVQLIDGRSDRHLWAQTYDRELEDILELQREVARDIGEEIQVALTPPPEPAGAKARFPSSQEYDDYLRGRYYWNKRTGDGLTKSIDYFNLAIKKDPTFALAYAGLADSYNMEGHWDILPARNAYPEAEAAALKALDLDSTLAQAHTSLGMTKMDFDWDFAGAQHEFDLALSVNSNYATAHQWRGVLLGVLGRKDESIIEERRALELDPLSPIIRSTLAWILYWAGRYDESIAESQKILAVDPRFALALYNLGRVYLLQGRYDQAIDQFRQFRALIGPGATGTFGHAYALAGRKGEARKLLAELSQRSKTMHVSPDEFALIYMGLGEKDRALLYLEKAYSERVNSLIYMRADARFDPLRTEPRFKALLRRVGLPQ